MWSEYSNQNEQRKRWIAQRMRCEKSYWKAKNALTAVGPKKMFKCVGCSMTLYCCRSHQKKSWRSTHAVACKTIQADRKVNARPKVDFANKIDGML